MEGKNNEKSQQTAEKPNCKKTTEKLLLFKSGLQEIFDNVEKINEQLLNLEKATRTCEEDCAMDYAAEAQTSPRETKDLDNAIDAVTKSVALSFEELLSVNPIRTPQKPTSLGGKIDAMVAQYFGCGQVEEEELKPNPTVDDEDGPTDDRSDD